MLLHNQKLIYHMLNETQIYFFFFFNDTATTEIYTLSLHDALPIFHSMPAMTSLVSPTPSGPRTRTLTMLTPGDRKSTRLNSSHQIISYAVFCLKKKKIELFMI